MYDDLGEYTSKDLDDWEKLGFFFGLVEFEGCSSNYPNNWTRLNCFGDIMQKGKKDKGDRWHVQSSLFYIKVLRPHLDPHLHLSHPLSHLFHHDHNHPLWDSMGLEMINFLEFSMKLLRNIWGKSSLSKVSYFLFL